MRWVSGVILVLAAATASAQTLVVGYSDSDPEPYYFVEEGNLVGGFFFDLGKELGKQLGVSVDFKAFPRKRIEDALAAGEVDVLPFENPGWDVKSERFVWSKPYFVKKSLILLPRLHTGDVTSAADLRGQRIGTILGYYYATLETDFSTGFFEREDVQTLKQNLAKLRAGRIDALVASDNELDWAVGLDSTTFKRGSWIVESTPVSMAISVLSRLAPENILKALEALQKAGAIQRIWTKYQR